MSDPAPYPSDAVLTAKEVCDALKISLATLDRINLPTIYIGTRSRRYSWRQVLQTLEGRTA
jgi:hypothetical protein